MEADVETWRPVTVEPYQKLYEVSDLGRVRRIGSDEPMKPDTSRPYLRVCLNAPGLKPRRFMVHRLVAFAFVPGGSECVNHANGRKHDNPPVTGEPTWDAPETRTLAKQACFDCHSNETEWPAYASIAPASWLVQRDVNEGRAVLNFSEWPRPQEEAKEAAEEVLEGEMPPAAYTVVHAHARLSAADRDRLAQGLARTLGVALKHEARASDR